MKTSAFWNGFLDGLAAPVMAFESATCSELPANLDEMRAELEEIVPRKSILDDMTAVYGDFRRALERTR